MKRITKEQIEKIMEARRTNSCDDPKGLIEYITFTFENNKGNVWTKDVPSNICINTEYFTIRKGGAYYSYNNVVSIELHYSKELAKEIRSIVSNIKVVDIVHNC